MAGTKFKTNPVLLKELLQRCGDGRLQLPEFQRSWVWDDERIRSLIASISRSFPVGALMTLGTGGDLKLKARPIEGVTIDAEPEALLLDGQQRMTSLFQAMMRDKVVDTITAKKKKVKRWYYIDMRKALGDPALRDEAILGVPEDRVVRRNFGREVELDISSPDKEYEKMMFPLTRVFDPKNWRKSFKHYWRDKGVDHKEDFFDEFEEEILESFDHYQVPVIALEKETSKEAVCVVFEKVNTGGKPLDAFELVTAAYAIDGFDLREDWHGRYARLKESSRLPNQSGGILEKVGSTDYLQAISLLHTKARRQEKAEAEGTREHELPAISATKQSLLNLPLTAYETYTGAVEEGFKKAARFLHMQRIYRVFDLPYQSQLVPLAAILVEIGDQWEHETVRRKIAQWYWNGVLGELYGSATESRFARDIADVTSWLDGGDAPTTVKEATFRADRLHTMRSRLSAAYKGVNALLMQRGAQDFVSGQNFDHTVFFDENVDIHHIFPRAWCEKNGIEPERYDSIINKTPLSARTNRILGGAAPSHYLGRLEKGAEGAPPIAPERLDGFLESHLIDPALLRADDFDRFFAARREALLGLIENATGQRAYRGPETDEPEIDVAEELADDDGIVQAAE